MEQFFVILFFIKFIIRWFNALSFFSFYSLAPLVQTLFAFSRAPRAGTPSACSLPHSWVLRPQIYCSGSSTLPLRRSKTRATLAGVDGHAAAPRPPPFPPFRSLRSSAPPARFVAHTCTRATHPSVLPHACKHVHPEPLSPSCKKISPPAGKISPYNRSFPIQKRASALTETLSVNRF